MIFDKLKEKMTKMGNLGLIQAANLKFKMSTVNLLVYFI
jgi:hypothetical protein